MATFTEKEQNLLFKTILERELGITLADDMKDIRSKNNIFANSDSINIERISEKVGKTRVSIFRTTYDGGFGGNKVAYSHTI